MSEVGQSLSKHWSAILLVAVFSVFVNALVLTGPLYMLQVYDRVLGSRSEATLVALTVLLAGLFAAMGLLEYVRARMGARIGASIQSDLDGRVFLATLAAPPQVARQAMTGLPDVEAIRRFFASPVAFAIFDVPFAPFFLLILFAFHPLMGWLAVAGGVVLVIVTVANQITSAKPGLVASQKNAGSARLAEQIRTEPDTIRALGMSRAAVARWRIERDASLEAEMKLQDRNGTYGGMTKTLRMFLQSGMLGLGAWLTLKGELSSGAMIAGSILMGRALAPVEQIIGSWAVVQRAYRGWGSLGVLLKAVPPDAPRMPLKRPASHLTVHNLTVVPPGSQKPVLRDVSFEVSPGQVLGVVGESASGKSSIARVLTGLWRPVSGAVRLDGAALDQYDEAVLASHIGYLPQDIRLFDGTVGENIARMGTEPDPAAIIAAAEAADAHRMILGLPQGYNTLLGTRGTALSGGQKQRIGLARALFGDPVALVLDEPNSNLDAGGSAAVNAAIRAFRAAGKIVIVMAHRPTVLAECDLVLVMRDGQNAGFGPRDEVLRRTLANAGEAPKIRQVV